MFNCKVLQCLKKYFFTSGFKVNDYFGIGIQPEKNDKFNIFDIKRNSFL